jgi:hypothetical protein
LIKFNRNQYFRFFSPNVSITGVNTYFWLVVLAFYDETKANALTDSSYDLVSQLSPLEEELNNLDDEQDEPKLKYVQISLA